MKNRDMTNLELSMAKRAAVHFGNPAIAARGRTSRNRILTSKTGFFTGYWNNGVVSWQGHFESGNQVGLWTYTSSLPDRVNSCDEFYCNL